MDVACDGQVGKGTDCLGLQAKPTGFVVVQRRELVTSQATVVPKSEIDMPQKEHENVLE
jgi:hypothetical protein